MGNDRTDILFSTSSFIGGMGSAVNLAGNYYDFNLAANGSIADIRAIYNDFASVADDLEAAQLQERLVDTESSDKRKKRKK